MVWQLILIHANPLDKQRRKGIITARCLWNIQHAGNKRSCRNSRLLKIEESVIAIFEGCEQRVQAQLTWLVVSDKTTDWVNERGQPIDQNGKLAPESPWQNKKPGLQWMSRKCEREVFARKMADRWKLKMLLGRGPGSVKGKEKSGRCRKTSAVLSRRPLTGVKKVVQSGSQSY